jgi:hypothetical protein
LTVVRRTDDADAARYGAVMDEQLRRLSELLRQRDLLDAEIAAITERSARPGDVGEFIATAVFDIALAPIATQPGLTARSAPARWPAER